MHRLLTHHPRHWHHTSCFILNIHFLDSVMFFLMEVPLFFFNREKTLFSSSFNFTWGQQKHMVYTTPGSLTARPWKMMVWKHTFPIWGKNNFSGAMSIQTVLVGGWTNPSQKYARQIGSFPEVSGWKEKIFELPPPMVFFGGHYYLTITSHHVSEPVTRLTFKIWRLHLDGGKILGGHTNLADRNL